MQKSHPRRKEVYFVSGIRFEKLKKMILVQWTMFLTHATTTLL